MMKELSNLKRLQFITKIFNKMKKHRLIKNMVTLYMTIKNTEKIF